MLGKTMNETLKLALSTVLIATLLYVFFVAKRKGKEKFEKVKVTIDSSLEQMADRLDFPASKPYKIEKVLHLFRNWTVVVALKNKTKVGMKIRESDTGQFVLMDTEIYTTTPNQTIVDNG
jgi:hypothetical protein